MIYADYSLYLSIEKRRQDGSFPAAVVLWRRGAQSAPLLDGERVAFVPTQSFGTRELSDETITCLRNGGGHYPGVPNNISFDAAAHPADIVIPKANILQRVMRQDNSLHYQRRGPGNAPVSDSQGRPVFDVTVNGPDLVISVQTLRDRLDAAYLA